MDTLTRRQRLIRREATIKLITVVGVLLFAFTIVLTVQNMLLSCILAFVISYMLSPFAHWLERRGTPARLAHIIPFIFCGILLAITINLFLPLVSMQIASFKSDLPKYVEGTTQLFQETEAKINLFLNSIYTVDISKNVESYIISGTSALFEDLPSILSKSVTTLVLAPFLAFFMIRDGRKAVNKILGMVPNSYFELALNLNHQLNDQIGGFIRARFLEASIVGLVVWLGLLIFGYPYAFLLGMFAALTNLIPYLGPFIGAIPALVISLINGGTGVDLVIICSIFSIAQLIDILFIIPLVVAKIVDLHPVSVVLVIVIGAQLMGILGMVISIPVASAIKVTLNVIYDHVLEIRR